MHRDADGPALVGDGAGDGLTDPPRCIGRELEAFVRLKFFRRLHQAEVALLDEVKEGQPPARIALGHRDYQPQVRFAELLPGFHVPCLGGTGQCPLFFGGKQRHPADLFQVGFHRVIQRNALRRELMLQPPDLRFVQQRDIRFLLGHADAAGFQLRIQRIQPGNVIILLVHRTADLFRRQGVPPGTSRQDLCQFLCLRHFPHNSFSFRLQPGGKGAVQSSAGALPCFFSRIDWRYRSRSSFDIWAALFAMGVPRAMRSR